MNTGRGGEPIPDAPAGYSPGVCKCPRCPQTRAVRCGLPPDPITGLCVWCLTDYHHVDLSDHTIMGRLYAVLHGPN